jgi:hypothetical protein
MSVIPIDQIMPAAVEQNRVRGLAPMITRIPAWEADYRCEAVTALA